MKPVILIVDDEQRILQAMSRLLRRDGYEILTADSGAVAVEILGERDVAVVVCDQRMPGMNGAAVLSQARRLRPDAYRVTVTGHSDLRSILASINDGGVHQFLLKPWNDEHLRRVVTEGIRLFQLKRENQRLAAVAAEQHDELEQWNSELEARVQQRTSELAAQNKRLDALQSQLQETLRDTVGLLSSMLEASSPNLAIHSKRVAQLALAVGRRLGMDELPMRDLEFAARLHDIGKIARFAAGAEQGRRRDEQLASRIAETGYALLSNVRGFEQVALAIQQQAAWYDGSAARQTSRGEDIPLAARIIAAANTYDDVVYSSSTSTNISRGKGTQTLLAERGHRLDPIIVDMLLEHIESAGVDSDRDAEVELSPRQVKEGMVLSRPLHGLNNTLLLPAGTVLTAEYLQHVRAQANINPLLSTVFVRCEPDESRVSGPARSPAAKPTATPAATAPGEPGTNEPRRALVVDDDVLVCYALRRELRRAGFDVTLIENGRTAQEVLEKEPFDVVLTDVAMPLMSGDALVAHIQMCWPELPCIVLTGNATREQLLRIKGLDCVLAVMAKPWDNAELLKHLDSITPSARLERSGA